MKFATKAIHAGQSPDPTTGAIMTPIYQTSTYVQESPGKHKGYDYARTNNPTRAALEANLAALEEGKYGVAFGSGCAAANTVMNLLKSGDHVVSCRDLYGGSYRLFTKVYEKYGIGFTFVNAHRLEEVAPAIRPETKLLWIETPSNPQLTIVDIKAVSEIAHAKGVKVAVDNTFASPFLQQPLTLGADIVVHSTTKYLGGHSDSVGGVAITNDAEIHRELKFYQNSVGAVPGPMDCFLILRGTKTLPVRMERHCANAAKVARFLAGHPEVGVVNYPGLESHPGHAIARKQMRDFGGMVSLELKGGTERNIRFAGSTEVFSLAESLGGVESLIGHPITMTHGSIPPEERKRSGLPDALVRLSVGIEDIDDLIEDLDRAIAKSKKG
ncbi:MAG: cystathionine gamma-synthase [Planctomycetes bacterium RBG_16_59_8]|nr:MAG: cystathionine gamma-synthase [Planctomycetes bacterium RBG_16_59_8]